jgi:pimeloyl-ACP methyl ester carboxylesterase
VTAAAADLDLWHGLPGLQVPVLVLRGEFSNTFFSHTARLFQRRLPAAEIHTIANAGHLVPLERPEETAVLIKKFIRKHTS